MPQYDTSPFDDIPWVSKLLQDDAFITVCTSSRQRKPTTEDSLFTKTLNSGTTISACLSQYKPRAQSASEHTIPSAKAYRMFFVLGTDLNGHADTLHGGMVSTLLDECMGLLLTMRDDDCEEAPGRTVTAYLNTRFLRPVVTPGTIVVQGRLTEVIENRKWRIHGDIRDGEDQVLATAECLYVRTRSKI